MPYPNKRNYTIHSARRWRTFPFFGYHVVKYLRKPTAQGRYQHESWHLSRYKALFLARELYQRDLTEFRKGEAS